MAADKEVHIDDEVTEIPLVASSLHSALPEACRIPYGFCVGYKKINCAPEFFENADEFFKAHAREWTEITSYQFPKEGTIMSNFIHGLVIKGMSIKTILDRCVQVKINNTVYFGVLNSAFNPFGDDVVPKHMIGSIVFVILVNQANVGRNIDSFIQSFANHLKEPVLL